MKRLSIGEVLNRLKGEFSDITISKIRFLDAEGLVEPDRSPAGYRQFTEDDVERLDYVLRAQRDRGLRLSQIAEELRRLDAGEDPRDVLTGADALRETLDELLAARGEDDDAPTGTAPPPAPHRPRSAAVGNGGPPSGAPGHAGDAVAAPRSADTSTARTLGVAADVHLSGRELADAAGLELQDVRSLQEHALLPPGDVFDGDALATATAASGLLAAGLEARHLRMYRQFGDREVSLFGQLVQPILRQRNPEARQRASQLLEALTTHGTQLHAALLRRELRDLLEP